MFLIGFSGFAKDVKLYESNRKQLFSEGNTFKWMCFISGDSAYNFTVFNSPNGEFYFEIGLVDSLYLENIYQIDKKGKMIPKDRNIRSHTFINGIDTIYTFKNSSFQRNLYKKSEMVYFRGVYYENSELLEEIRISYIISKIGHEVPEISSDTVIRILYPYYSKNSTDYYLEQVVLGLNKQDFFFSHWKSIDNTGLKSFFKTDTIHLSDKRVKKIRKLLTGLDVKQSAECTFPGESGLMEITSSRNYKMFLLSDECINRNKAFKEESSLYYYLIGFVFLIENKK